MTHLLTPLPLHPPPPAKVQCLNLNFSQVSPVSHYDASASIDKDGVQSVPQDVSDYACSVPSDFSEGCLVLNYDSITNCEFWEDSTSFVKTGLHLDVQLCCQCLSFLSP